MVHFEGGRTDGQPASRWLVEERVLTIEVQGGEKYHILRTPGQDRELCVGFLLSEGLIEKVEDLLTLQECSDDPNTIRVRLPGRTGEAGRRNLAVRTSCGLCGKVDLEAMQKNLGLIDHGVAVPIQALYRLPDQVRARQELFRQTGSTHAAALFDGDGEILAVREDLGRHNAMDKVLGWALLAGRSTANLGCFLSGRVSLEMIIKAARGRIALVAAVSAPTLTAVDLANRLGIALCGFVRGDEVVVYSHHRRIAQKPAAR